ncbi:FRG domain-containing protein [Desulfovermiculus halophilus]|uniref:FRG domain-containing protein n=1 Tax=Desulfovermiculus halophilus TaxID=339722 RepID=UPI0009FC5845|nr:FRG domain-containing protein [Desulfovermiculus halophilus]
MEPIDFWEPTEETVDNFSELQSLLEEVFAKGPKRGRTFAWRGQLNAEWPLTSSLYRRLKLALERNPEERDLYNFEGKILANVHRWGLHMSKTQGRLSVLNQLATMQHYGAPTRMIDVSFNPWIGIWFAVEQRFDNGNVLYVNEDARVFAIDVTDSLINANDQYRSWEDELKRPWRVGHPWSKSCSPDEGGDKEQYLEWCTKPFAWRPAHFDNRIAAQNGGFVLGGAPLSYGPGNRPNQWPRDGGGYWTMDEVRDSTSISVHPNRLKSKGRVSSSAVYSIRIRAAAKEKIRKRLQTLFGYEHRTLYPDFAGFAQFGTAKIKNL